jgi:hypothetical protein
MHKLEKQVKHSLYDTKLHLSTDAQVRFPWQVFLLFANQDEKKHSLTLLDEQEKKNSCNTSSAIIFWRCNSHSWNATLKRNHFSIEEFIKKTKIKSCSKLGLNKPLKPPVLANLTKNVFT